MRTMLLPLNCFPRAQLARMDLQDVTVTGQNGNVIGLRLDPYVPKFNSAKIKWGDYPESRRGL